MSEGILERLEAFCKAQGFELRERLGFGMHGQVWVGESLHTGTILALKIFESSAFYERERDVYRRLAEYRVSRICRCRVPQLEIADDAYEVVGITLVKRPFVLDFAGAQLDFPLDFPPEVMAEWMADRERQFAEEDWPRVLEILGELEGMGIYLTDISPSNISLLDYSRPESPRNGGKG